MGSPRRLAWWSMPPRTATPSGCVRRSLPGWCEVGLELHPDKTKIVYCKDDNRRGGHEHTAFTFLGYTFRARSARNKHGRMFASFLPAVSRDALVAIRADRSAGGVSTCEQVATIDRTRTVDEPHRAGLDAVLRGVQPLRAVSAATRASTPTWCGGPARSTGGCTGLQERPWCGGGRSPRYPRGFAQWAWTRDFLPNRMVRAV